MKEQLMSITRSTSFRLAVTGVLFLLLMIPRALIVELIDERQAFHGQVIDEVSSIWGGSQTLSGPILTIPYRLRNEDGEWITRNAHFLPDGLEIKAEMEPEIRYRNIYKVLVYRANIEMSGNFRKPDLSELNISPDQVLWQEAFISLGITDLRGVAGEISFRAGDRELEMNPGIPTGELYPSGVFTRWTPGEGNAPFSFHTRLELRGSQALLFAPLGRTTTAELHSSYPDPSFCGAFLPEKRETGPDGFSASWKVSHLNRNLPQQWTGNAYRPGDMAFGAELIIPADQYQQTQRSAKYAVLFIGLTFLVFFLSEILHGKRIHPVQYLMAGFALVLFYVLLLSISEHLGFRLAYLISALATTTLLSYYCRYLFEGWRSIAMIAGLLLFMYGFLFILIQLEGYSLLVGSIGLFVILAAVMVLTGRVNWYRPLDN